MRNRLRSSNLRGGSLKAILLCGTSSALFFKQERYEGITYGHWNMPLLPMQNEEKEL